MLKRMIIIPSSGVIIMSDYNLGPYRPHPVGEYDPAREYQYLDIVTYNGASYINCNLDTIDGVSCIGILPTGEPRSEMYWQCLAMPGEKGETADVYAPYATVIGGAWDFRETDKIFIPENAPNAIAITNVYNGACGIIISRLNLTLPRNSMKSSDFDYLDLNEPGQYYFYTFIYTPIGDDYWFIWHRSVISR